MKSNHSPFSKADQRGIALVLTLTILALVTILLIGFTVSMRVESMSAKSFNDTIKTRLLAEGVVDLIVNTLQSNMPTPTAQSHDYVVPGAVFRHQGYGAWSRVSLSSSSTNTNDYVNINVNGSLSGSLAGVLTNGWTNLVLNTSNLVARYSWYVDVEDTKVNVNTAQIRTNALGPPGTASGPVMTDQIDLTALGVANTVAMNDIGLYAITSTNYSLYKDSAGHAEPFGFLTPEHWRIKAGPTLGNTNRFHVTITSWDDTNTVWGTPKLNPNFMTDSDVTSLIGIADPMLTNWFGTNTWFAKAGQTFSGNTFPIATNWPLTSVYSTEAVCRVWGIMANIRDFTRTPPSGNVAPFYNSGSQFLYGDANDLFANPTHTSEYFKGVPLYYLGLPRYLMLNEIIAQMIWFPKETAPGLTNMFFALHLYCELLNPHDVPLGAGGSVKGVVDRLGMLGAGSTCPNCANNMQPNTAFGQNFVAEVLITNDVQPHWYGSVDLWFTNKATSDCDNSCLPPADSGGAVALVSRVQLFQKKGDPRTIQDWASGYDLVTRIATPATPVAYGTVTNQFWWRSGKVRKNLPNDPSAKPWTDAQYLAGIAKNDPRVKSVFGLIPTPRPNIWFQVGGSEQSLPTLPVLPTTTPGANNPAGVISTNIFSPLKGMVDCDDLRAAPWPFEVSTSPYVYVKGAPYTSLRELGYIHVPGLQWRTLRLMPRSDYDRTAKAIPDWTVLDLFTVQTNLAYGKININGRSAAAYVPTRDMTANSFIYPERIDALQTLLTATNAWNNGPGALPASSRAQIASNIYYMGFLGPNNYQIFRADRTNQFKFLGDDISGSGILQQRYNFLGELCEISGVVVAAGIAGVQGISAADDNMFESRIGSFIDLITLNANTFTIWVIVQPIRKADTTDPSQFHPELGDSVSGEAKMQVLVQRYIENGQVRFRKVYSRLITD